MLCMTRIKQRLTLLCNCFFRKDMAKGNKDIIKSLCEGSDTLASRLRQCAERQDLMVIELSFGIMCVMPSESILTIYAQPMVLNGVTGRFYGEIFFPFKDRDRNIYIEEDQAVYLYRKLGKLIQNDE